MSSGRSRPEWLPEVDLRSATRNSDRVCTTIDVVQMERFAWLKFGSLSRLEHEQKTPWLGAYFAEGITDEEEDSAYALSFDIVGLQLEGVHQGITTLRAWIAGAAGDSESFKVPSVTYDLTQFKWCPRCQGQDRHQIASYTPKPNLELWKRLRGCEISICISPVIPEDEA